MHLQIQDVWTAITMNILSSHVEIIVELRVKYEKWKKKISVLIFLFKN